MGEKNQLQQARSMALLLGLNDVLSVLALTSKHLIAVETASSPKLNEALKKFGEELGVFAREHLSQVCGAAVEDGLFDEKGDDAMAAMEIALAEDLQREEKARGLHVDPVRDLSLEACSLLGELPSEARRQILFEGKPISVVTPTRGIEIYAAGQAVPDAEAIVEKIFEVLPEDIKQSLMGLDVDQQYDDGSDA